MREQKEVMGLGGDDVMVSGEVVVIEILVYWLISAVVIIGVDFYARKKLGKESLGYLSLRIPKFIIVTIISVLSMAIILYTRWNDISVETMSFIGAPYLGLWFYYMVMNFRRIRAEGSGRRKGD